MFNDAVAHDAVGGRHTEPLARGLHQHRAGRCARAAHRQPGVAHAARAACRHDAHHLADLELGHAGDRRHPAAVVGPERHAVSQHGGVGIHRIDRRLLEAHLVEVRVQLFGHQHRQRGRDPLAHFLARHLDRDAAIGGDLDPGGKDCFTLARLQAGRWSKPVALAVHAPKPHRHGAAQRTDADEEAATQLAAWLSGRRECAGHARQPTSWPAPPPASGSPA